MSQHQRQWDERESGPVRLRAEVDAMVAFRIDGQQLAMLDDAAFVAVLEAAGAAGGPDQYPTLHALTEAVDVINPLAVLDELGRLGATEHGHQVAMLIGSLRDDLMEAVSAAEEG